MHPANESDTDTQRRTSRIGPSLKANLSPAEISSEPVLLIENSSGADDAVPRDYFNIAPEHKHTNHIHYEINGMHEGFSKVSGILQKTFESPIASPFSSSDSLASLVERQHTSKINHPGHSQILFNTRRPSSTRKQSRNSLFGFRANSIDHIQHHRTHSSAPYVKSPLSEKLNPFNTLFINSDVSQSSRKLEPASSNPHHVHSTPEVKESNRVYLEYDPVSRRKVLNTYEIVKEIGRGQHGKVKLAKDLVTEELVAIKIVDRRDRPRLGRPQKQGTSQEDKIRKEIAIMKKCNHPNVVQLKEVLDDVNSRKIYLVLEYLENGEVKWQETPGNPVLNLRQAMSIFRDVVLGLEYLHYQGIIHRDIKPANLLLSSENVVKISDFGVSFASPMNEHRDEVDLCKTAGTPAFFAPELCSPLTDRDNSLEPPKISNKIDIWSLGITLYCLIFGDMPFWGRSEFELFDCICNGELKFPSKFPSNFQWTEEDKYQVKNLLIKLLHKDPSQRISIKRIKKHPLVLRDLSIEDAKNFYEEQKSCESKIHVSNEEVKVAVTGIGNKIRKGFAKALEFAGLSHSRSSLVPEVNSSKERPRTRSDNLHDCSVRSLILPEISNRKLSPNQISHQSNGPNIHHKRVKSGDITGATKTTVEGDLFLNKTSVLNTLSGIMDHDKRRSSITSSLMSSNSEGFTTSNDSSIGKGNQTVSLPVNASFASLDSVYLDSFASNYTNSSNSRVPSNGTAEVTHQMNRFSMNKPLEEKKVDEAIPPKLKVPTFSLNSDDDDSSESEISDESDETDDQDNTVRPLYDSDASFGASELSVPAALANDLQLSKTHESTGRNSVVGASNATALERGTKTANIVRRGGTPKYSFLSGSSSESSQSEPDSETEGEKFETTPRWHRPSKPTTRDLNLESAGEDEDVSESEDDEGGELTLEFRPRRSEARISDMASRNDPDSKNVTNNRFDLSNGFDTQRVSSPLSKNAPKTPVANANAHLIVKIRQDQFINHYNKDHRFYDVDAIDYDVQSKDNCLVNPRHRSKSVTVGLLKDTQQQI